MILCFDTETTGLAEEDEIVQLSIASVNDYGSRCELNEYFRPNDYLMERGWPEAAEVTGITPESVSSCPSLQDPEIADEVQRIFDQADLLIGYHVIYDIHMLQKAGIDVSSKLFNDPMYAFAAYYWHTHPDENYVTHSGKTMNPWMGWKDNPFGGKGQWINRNLSLAAETLCNKVDFGAHDSMNDVFATIAVWQAMNAKQDDLEMRGWAYDEYGDQIYDANGNPCHLDEEGNPLIDPNGNSMEYVYDYTLEQLEILDA